MYNIGKYSNTTLSANILETKHVVDLIGNNILQNLVGNGNFSRWRHDMKMLSTLLALCEGNPLAIGGFMRCLHE